MKTSRLLPLALLLLGLAGCASSPDDRVAQNAQAFSSYPPDVQAKIRQGIVGIGFTPDQVLMARGKPDYRALRQTATGQSEDWYYGDHRARIGFGIGGFDAGPRSAVGGSASVSGIPLGHEHMLRVIFDNGVVSALEGPPQTPL